MNTGTLSKEISAHRLRINGKRKGRAHRSKTNKKVEIVPKGSIEFRIYKQVRGQYVSHVLAYRLNGRRRRVVRADRADLDEQIELAEIAIANGQTATLDFTESARASYLRCLELARGANAPIELLVAEAVEARKKNSRASIVHKCCPDVVAELLETKRRQKKVGAKWLRNLEAMLDRLAEFYPGPIHLLRASDINRFLDGLQGGLVYRRHHRSTVLELTNYAKGRDYMPRDWNELKLVDDPDPAPVKIQIWTPDQMVKLLACTLPSMIPFTCLAAFAGIRHEEMVPGEADSKKAALDWRDFDWEEKQIHISAETGKTGDRVIPMSDNLIAWLTPYRKESGPICKLRDTGGCLAKAKRRAKLPAGKGESRNVLRKSFISYRIGLTNNRGQVAEETGTSLAKIKSNYRRAATESQAKKWFGILPTDSEILQLDFFRRTG